MKITLKNGKETNTETIKKIFDDYIETLYGKKPLIDWKDGVIPPTKWWYDESDNKVHTDCGVSIEFNHELDEWGAYCCIDDLIPLIIEYYATVKSIKIEYVYID